jgi:membrane-associated protease RseP (regulator of RpoE activity)
MKYRILAVSIALAMTAPLIATTASAAESTTPAAASAVQVQSGGYLGVLVGPVPDALRAQLGGVLPSGQGVLIRDVEAGSPAAEAGLKAYDVLIGFDDQKLYSPDQLTDLVRGDRPDTTVKLSLVRAGSVQNIQVTLGQVEAQPEAAVPQLGMRVPRHHPGPYATSPGPSQGNWESFDALSLKKLEDGSFKAAIQYRSDEGKLVKQEFTGSLDSIRQQVMGEQNLPPVERHQLLEALSARDYFFPPTAEWVDPRFYMPQWFYWQPGF